ncbi:MAG: M23 family metallopeptidase [Nitriliruptorales bacterium]|nr:M23 family metallopeptidase [Nitriliruptorales bacterium]
MARIDFSGARTSLRPRASRSTSTPALFTPPKKRGRVIAGFLVLGSLITLPAAWSGAISDGDDESVGQAEAVLFDNTPAREQAAGQPAAEVEATAPFASFEDMTLHQPGESVLLIGYHEASFRNALAITPLGDALANDNRTKFVPANETASGPEYVILSSRGRPTPATSAIDVVMEDDTPVLAPVSGTVRDVRPYLLYGKYDDTRVEIVPEGRPDLAIVMIHVRDVAVRRGDRIEGGVTILAGGPNRFPFGSQIDRFFDPDRWPHVHIEVKHR